VAWYQFGSETVVIANASATANHVDMEIVLNGVVATKLSTAAGVNFAVHATAARAPAAVWTELFIQAIAAGLGETPSAFATSVHTPDFSDQRELLAQSPMGIGKRLA
jgi:hypothetical protein